MTEPYESGTAWSAAFPEASEALQSIEEIRETEAHARAFAAWKSQYPEAAAAWAKTQRASLRARGYQI